MRNILAVLLILAVLSLPTTFGIISAALLFILGVMVVCFILNTIIRNPKGFIQLLGFGLLIAAIVPNFI
jgi:hypothetical protein